MHCLTNQYCHQLLSFGFGDQSAQEIESFHVNSLQRQIELQKPAQIE